MKRIAIQIEFETMDELREYLAIAPSATVSVPAQEVVDVATEIPVVEAPTPEFDAEGLKWDERIHSSSKKLTAKGVWARRKNITDDEFSTISAQLKGTPAPAPAPAEVVVPTPHVVAPLPPPPPAPSPIATPVHGNGGITIVDLLKRCSDLQGQGKLTQEMKDQAAQAAGLADFKQVFLAPKPELVGQLITIINSMVA